MSTGDTSWRDHFETVDFSQDSSPTSGITVRDNGVLVPVMDEHEVSQRVMSRGKRMVRIDPPTGLGPEEFKSVLGVSFMLYMRDGGLPDDSLLAEYLPTIDSKTLRKVISTPQYFTALRLRGVTVGSVLTPEQDMAIAIMSSPTAGTFEQRLKKAGVAPSKWRAWLRNKHFRAVYDSMGASVLSDYETDMMNSLVNNALNGDTQSIKLAFEISGRHSPTRQGNFDATVFVAQVIEIIQQEVKDPETLQRIAARMQMVGSQPSARTVLEQGINSRQIEG